MLEPPVLIPTFAPQDPVVLTLEQIETISREGVEIGRLFAKQTAGMRHITADDLQIRVK